MNTLATKIFLVVLIIISCLTLSQSVTYTGFKSPKTKQPKPCKELVLYLHGILFNGFNLKNATSAGVTQPSPLGFEKKFGKMVVLNDPVTTDNHLLSPRVARAQGFYFFNGVQDNTAWFAMTLVFNSTEYKGTLTIMGADIIYEKSRDLPVVGGTGDFLMAKGVCTVQTDYTNNVTYFRQKMDIKLYQCY